MRKRSYWIKWRCDLKARDRSFVSRFSYIYFS
jgi:hypothetical protein